MTHFIDAASPRIGTSELPAAGPDTRARLSAIERCISICTAVRPGEGKSTVLFFAYAFQLLVCYYILKTVREPLLLAGGSAALKSYAYAVIAAVLVLLVPLYGVLFRRTGKRQLVRLVTLFFAASLILLYTLGRAGLPVGFVYYVWVGVFGVMVLTQFWAHAAHSYKVENGQRLFPVIMAGAALGGLVGPRLSGALFEALGPWNLMLTALALMLATLPLVEWTWRAVPASARNSAARSATAKPHLLGGLALVLRDRYLLLLATLVVLLNCVGTTGEYLLTELVLRNAEDRVAADPSLDKGVLIAQFYGDYYFAVNGLGLALQLFMVARVFRWIGVQGALLVSPLIAIVGYGLILFVPVFGLIRIVKVLENGTDYTLMNTVRQVLYLPLPAAHQYEGKTAVDAFFFRCGDVLQAGLVFVGLNYLGFGFEQFILLNLALALAWLLVALRIGARYPREGAPRRPPTSWRPFAVGTCAAAFAVVSLAVPRNAAAEPSMLFVDDSPLTLELRADWRSLCRGTGRRGCADLSATLVTTGADGREHAIDVTLRARGKWRNDRSNCSVPPLFLFIHGATAGTAFEDESMLPLTTHCRERPDDYEQYVLKEYFAYRIYNLLTDTSLRVRLARIVYRDTARKRDDAVERFAFFTEHFASLAARHGLELRSGGDLDPATVNTRALATLELFQYLIGNSDWSVRKGHNVARFRGPGEAMTVVPFDFDFSGLVDAAYAGPPPQLPIRSVTERLYRGFCHPNFDWNELFATFTERRGAIDALPEQLPGLDDDHARHAREFIAEFFGTLDSTREREERIVAACRPYTP